MDLFEKTWVPKFQAKCLHIKGYDRYGHEDLKNACYFKRGYVDLDPFYMEVTIYTIVYTQQHNIICEYEN